MLFTAASWFLSLLHAWTRAVQDAEDAGVSGDTKVNRCKDENIQEECGTSIGRETLGHLLATMAFREVQE